MNGKTADGERRDGQTDGMLVRCCAPTLAGIKTGSLFSCPFAEKETMIEEARRLNRRLRFAGLRALPLWRGESRALIYLFLPEKLEKDLSEREAAELLKEMGYKDLRMSQCIKTLMERLRESECFPHEIGLFLGYPPEDVRGFIKNRARNYKCAGYWKVYGNAEHARSVFEQYRCCTEIFCARFQEGVPLESLHHSVRENLSASRDERKYPDFICPGAGQNREARS